MNVTKPAVLLFNGTKYNLEALIKMAKTCPSIFIDGNEINPVFGDTANPEHKTSVDCVIEPEMKGYDDIFFKQHGKYTVLFSNSLKLDNALAAGIPDGKFKGRLISTPTLKKVRMVQPFVHQPMTAVAANYDSSFANHPRFVKQSNF